ncbi:nitroreductase family protein [Mycoplasmatota bacterium]|nr:nitroreductase family protein [Mycoplasmatota bacterium]
MIIELLKKRCSVRKFENKKIPDDITNSILEAGRLSPSGGNEQSWKFGVIQDKNLISKISNFAYKQNWLVTAPLLIVLCTVIVGDDIDGRRIQKARFPRFEKEIDQMKKDFYSFINCEEHQTKILGSHMILRAIEEGVYSTWVSYFDVEKVSDLLGLPNNVIASEIIAFGYPKVNQVVTRKKKNLSDIIFYNNFGESA